MVDLKVNPDCLGALGVSGSLRGLGVLEKVVVIAGTDLSEGGVLAGGLVVWGGVALGWWMAGRRVGKRVGGWG